MRKPRNLFILTRKFSIDLLDDEFKQKLANSIKQNKIQVLIIDTINPVTPSIDDNRAKDVTEVFNEFFKPFVENYGLNILYLAHTDKKGNDILGSTKWKANADNVFFFDRKGLDNEVVIQNIKNRWGEILTFYVEVEFIEKNKNLDKIVFNLLKREGTGRKGKISSKPKQEAKKLILNALKGKECSFSELRDICVKNGISEGTFKNARKDLVNKNLITTNNEGEYWLKNGN